MAFVRCRTAQTKRYGETKSHQLIETYRENGRVKQRVLANLGDHPTVEEALAGRWVVEQSPEVSG